MAWTYGPDFTTDRDQIRLLIGDTDTTDQQLLDSEIAYFVSSEMTVYMAASRCASALYAKYSRQADKAVGDLKISMGQIANKYKQMAADLASARGKTYAIPSAGGITVAEAITNENDASLRHTTIRRGMHDFVTNPVTPNTEPS